MKPDDLSETLFPTSSEGGGVRDESSLLTIYGLLVEMADRVSQRRQAANSFFLSVNTAFLSVFYVFRPEDLDFVASTVVAIAGITLCLLWERSIQTYRDLNSGKFAVICELEKRLGCAPYTAEWQYLKRGKISKRYHPFSQVEIFVPYIFVAIFIFIFLRAIPYDELMTYFAERRNY